MPIEQTVITDELTAQGISTTLATGLSFETPEELTAWVGAFKTAMPTVKSIEQYTKDELEELAKDPTFKGAKGLQGFIDSVRTKAKIVDPKPDDKKPDDKKPFEMPEEYKQMLEQTKVLNARIAKSEFETAVKAKAKLAELNDDATAKVLKILKVGDDDTKVDAEIKEMKDMLVKMGVKNMGTPGGGQAGAASSVAKVGKAWAEKQKARKAKFNSKK